MQRENIYVNLINLHVEKEALEIVQDAYNNNPESMIHINFSTEGGEPRYASAIIQILRNEKHRTRIHFTDECSSVGIMVLQEAIILGIASVVFPLLLTIHAVRCEVEMIGPGEYLSETDHQSVREVGIYNARLKEQPFYKAMTRPQRNSYDKGEDVVLTTAQTEVYLNALTELINNPKK